MLTIKYGIKESSIDVTQIVYNSLKIGNTITIPADDNTRARYLTDPLHGILKSIFIIDDQNNITEYDHTKIVCIDTNTSTVTIDNTREKLHNIHNRLSIKHGSFNDEYPEQVMATKYLTGNEKVLELGGNIGRNTLVIATILNRSDNLVSLECDPNIALQLTENRDINHLNFHIEDSALSKRNLIQKGWETIISEVVLPGYKKVKTITFEELTNKYKIQFDTLVIDCEGAFYYILQDFPEILNNIKLVIMENDYWNLTHKNYVDNVLRQNGLSIDYIEAGGWGPCYNNFYEVWKKN